MRGRRQRGGGAGRGGEGGGSRKRLYEEEKEKENDEESMEYRRRSTLTVMSAPRRPARTQYIGLVTCSLGHVFYWSLALEFRINIHIFKTQRRIWRIVARKPAQFGVNAMRERQPCRLNDQWLLYKKHVFVFYGFCVQRDPTREAPKRIASMILHSGKDDAEPSSSALSRICAGCEDSRDYLNALDMLNGGPGLVEATNLFTTNEDSVRYARFVLSRRGGIAGAGVQD